MKYTNIPKKQGLYDPGFEHDACGMGFVTNIKGEKSHKIIQQALEVLVRLSHRGATGSEANTGDGAGILLQIPDRFFRKESKSLGFKLPAVGDYGVGMVFLPQDREKRLQCEEFIGNIIEEEGQKLLAWRTVPLYPDKIGESALSCMPYMKQVFIEKSCDIKDELSFARKLYLIRKRIENEIRKTEHDGEVYFASLSHKTIVYKGMLMPEQLEDFFPDLSENTVETAIAMVHSRFSTNTFPSWERAHPNRYIIHNGEINTMRGNVNWLNARQSLIKTDVFADDINKVFPIINPDGSDSAMFDNCLEFLTLTGRSLTHSVMMMIPEPWENNHNLEQSKKDFYEYHSCLMEPWDGPAAMAFTDGEKVGAVLDRNGLRPSRYYVTKDDLVILASEVGVIDIPEERILEKQRLEPGRILLIDTNKGKIINDHQLKEDMAAEKPYRKFLDENLLDIDSLSNISLAQEKSEAEKQLNNREEIKLLQKQKAFGYTYEDIRKTIIPMAKDAKEPIGSMGYDASLAVLSEQPQLLYNYFKQLFAQVTNPPIDSIREEIVTATRTYLGSERNLVDPQAESCRQICISSPILDEKQFAKLDGINRKGFKSRRIKILFDINEENSLERSMDRLFAKADSLIDEGVNILILSDKGLNKDKAAIPALLAVSGLHHHLIRTGKRTSVSLVLESGEPREVHHFSLVLGFGVEAIYPYLAYQSLENTINEGLLLDISLDKAIENYIKAATKGIVKVMAKMGISTIQSYRGAQIFEAIGLNKGIIDRYFTGTPSRINGIGIEEIALEAIMKHEKAFKKNDSEYDVLDSGNNFSWRKDGEEHLYNPESIYLLQKATRENDYQIFKKYSSLINDQNEKKLTIRGLFRLDYDQEAIPLEEVESVDSICKRFKTGAMSYGSISKEAHETLAIAMNRIGGKSNSGEGGEDPQRFFLDENGDSRASAIKQVASARFGVTANYLTNAREIQIKMAQGAKPGEGGHLPGKKVYPWIAKVRGTTAGVSLVSPPPHHDIYSIEDLSELIYDLKSANRNASINVKLVSEMGVGTIAAGVAKGKADVILISGYDGGTGASPRTSIKHAGLPWELGLAETHQTLLLNNLRSRVKLETDGKLMTGKDLAIAALLGAEEYGFATAPLVVMGCVMMRVCNLDTCPVGVATQNPELRKKFMGKAENVVNFMRFIAQELREEMARLGFRTIDEMIGRVDKLKRDESIEHWKTKNLDFQSILYKPELDPSIGLYKMEEQDHGLDKSMDMKKLISLCKAALDDGEKVNYELDINNVDRGVGTVLGNEISKRYGEEGLAEDTINLSFKGSAGQSFAAFIPKGISLTLEGDSNDYLGKGLSGGKIIVKVAENSTYLPEENIITGNVALFGASSGEAYIQGVAGERFCVRNSGVKAVVEGVGDHGCEYMTGGIVVVLGETGRNFAAGMSGGVAYVLDEKGDFREKCKQPLLDLESLEEEKDISLLKEMIEKHYKYTNSKQAKNILDKWIQYQDKFIKIIPVEYKRMIKTIEDFKAQGLAENQAILSAFEKNTKEKRELKSREGRMESWEKLEAL
ncbi:glutamate synthase large subunit [Natronospora cellulosivora (SeqCode)]